MFFEFFLEEDRTEELPTIDLFYFMGRGDKSLLPDGKFAHGRRKRTEKVEIMDFLVLWYFFLARAINFQGHLALRMG